MKAPEMNNSDIEASVVIPCLNEADTLEVCIRKADRALTEAGIRHEIIVADNGSTDGSREIAAASGARVVPVPKRGYGAALMGGIEAAAGSCAIMADGDDSYDFAECPRFVAKLREGAEFVQGCRLPAGGGTVMPGAMPWSHRWIGTPLFTFLARRWFGARIHDINCGYRAFTLDAYRRLGLRCTGLEFATEMIVKACIHDVKITEVPICLHPDGRKAHPPHLRTMRDGWRHLRLLLMCSPHWLFMVPGTILILAGLLGYALALGHVQVGRAVLDVHTLLVSGAILLCGYQAIAFSLIMKTFALREGWQKSNPLLERLYRWFDLEKGLLAGLACAVAGLGMIAWTFAVWARAGFGELDYRSTMRAAIPGAMLLTLGAQTCFLSFFSSTIGMWRK